MSVKKILALLLFCVSCSVGDTARILGIFPTTAPSHYILGNALLKGLAEAGHNVTMISPFEEKNPPKGGSYRDIVVTGPFDLAKFLISFLDNKKHSTFEMIFVFLDAMFQLNDQFFTHENVQKLLKSDEEFDLVIVEQFLNDAMKVFGHIYNVPVIALSTMGATPWVNSMVGNPSPVSFIPQLENSVTPYMTFKERSFNLFSYLMYQLMEGLLYFPAQNRALKKHFPDGPDIYDLFYNVSLVFLNSHESLNQPVPLVPNMIPIGGYHVKPPRGLPKDLQKFLDNATEGVVYFSLGSNLKSKNLPAFKRDAFLTALGKLKEKVLWKWEDDDLPGKPPNVKLAKWLPQQDILAHPNVKLFITHGGLLSTTETIYHGVPILAIPVFGDQPMNAQLAAYNGYALCLPYEDPSFSEEKLSEMLHELLTNPKYRENVKKRSRLFHDRPMKPMDTAVYWVEYVIRNKGADHLKVAGVRFPWYKYQLLDVISFMTVLISLIAYVIYICIRKMLRWWGISGKVNSKSKND